MPSVLFVSKPMEPPLHDGSKCLVQGVAANLVGFDPVVMTTARSAPDLHAVLGISGLRTLTAYRQAGSFAPSLFQNVRAFRALAAYRAADVWHFVFAPNRRASRAISALLAIRRVPSVQTIASAPRSFDDVRHLLFGDVVVAQSRWTERCIADACRAEGVTPDVRVVPPPLHRQPSATDGEVDAVLAGLNLPRHGTVFVYPGDLEVGSGAAFFARLVAPLMQRIPDAYFVFACRAKTARAPEVQRRLQATLDPSRVRFAGELPNLAALYRACRAVLFPVDDLWGKVDLPIAVLEAMALGVPVVALGQGPLEDLEGVVKMPSLDVAAWAEATASLTEGTRRESVAASQRQGLERHSPAAVARIYERIYEELHRGVALTRDSP